MLSRVLSTFQSLHLIQLFFQRHNRSLQLVRQFLAISKSDNSLHYSAALASLRIPIRVLTGLAEQALSDHYCVASLQIMAETAAASAPSVPPASSTTEMENTLQENGSTTVDKQAGGHKPESTEEGAGQASPVDGTFDESWVIGIPRLTHSSTLQLLKLTVRPITPPQTPPISLRFRCRTVKTPR